MRVQAGAGALRRRCSLLRWQRCAAGAARRHAGPGAAGKLTLGYRADARPFSYRDEAGKPAGYSVALCQKIAEQVKTELGLPRSPWSGCR